MPYGATEINFDFDLSRFNRHMAQRQLHLSSLRNDRNLARFVIEGRATGRQLGTGSYGSVEEVRKGHESRITELMHTHTFTFQIEINGLICAGKKIHEILIDADNAGVEMLLASMCRNAS